MNPLPYWIPNNRVLAAFCSVVIATIALFVWITPGVIESRAAVVGQLEEEVAFEGRAACERWGLPAESAAHVACITDLAVIRTNHDNRRSIDGYFPY